MTQFQGYEQRRGRVGRRRVTRRSPKGRLQAPSQSRQPPTASKNPSGGVTQVPRLGLIVLFAFAHTHITTPKHEFQFSIALHVLQIPSSRPLPLAANMGQSHSSFPIIDPWECAYLFVVKGCYELASSSRSSSPSGSERSSCSSDCDSDDDQSDSDVELNAEVPAQAQPTESEPEAKTSAPAETTSEPCPMAMDIVADEEQDIQAIARNKPLPESDSESSSRVMTPPPQEDEDMENQRLKKSQDKGKGKEVVETIPSPSSSVDGDDSASKRQLKRKKERTVSSYRPILTIRQSHGWVWNQDLFVPPYMKDRCTFLLPVPFQQHTDTPTTDHISVSPPNPNISLNAMDYQPETVEIRVEAGVDGALKDLLFY